MALNFFKRRNLLKQLNYLEATPIRKCAFETAENGLITLVIPKFKNEKVNNYLLSPRKRFFRIALDELGTSVWMHIDGTKKVMEICKQVYDIYGEKIMPVDQRVTRFLTMLYEGKYISFKEIEKDSSSQ
ncbi:MAG TPA: PqqD family protein [Bacteroidales bacterium]|nr:PqqD family protein [Bacteroidales bacterium]